MKHWEGYVSVGGKDYKVFIFPDNPKVPVLVFRMEDNWRKRTPVQDPEEIRSVLVEVSKSLARSVLTLEGSLEHERMNKNRSNREPDRVLV